YSLFPHSAGQHRRLHPLPTRRSSDLPPIVPSQVANTNGNYFISANQYSNMFTLNHSVSSKPLFGGNDVALDPEANSAWNDPEERSEEHTSELQSRFDLVCRLLLEKKK